jgi:hypothetical protein
MELIAIEIEFCAVVSEKQQGSWPTISGDMANSQELRQRPPMPTAWHSAPQIDHDTAHVSRSRALVRWGNPGFPRCPCYQAVSCGILNGNKNMKQAQAGTTKTATARSAQNDTHLPWLLSNFPWDATLNRHVGIPAWSKESIQRCSQYHVLKQTTTTGSRTVFLKLLSTASYDIVFLLFSLKH